MSSDSLESSSAMDEKRNRLFTAVKENNVELIRNLLDSPKWYAVGYSNFGINLLQAAITLDSCDVFEYLVSLPNYPLEFEDRDGDTALMTSLELDSSRTEYYAYKLIRKGASVNKITKGGYTPLHQALRRKYGCVSKLLILRGSNVNVCDRLGFRPLELLNQYGWNETDDFDEIFITLLLFGADPFFKDKNLKNCMFFEACVLKFDLKSVDLLQVLFYFTYDKYTALEINFWILLELAVKFSPVFEEMIKPSNGIIVNVNYDSDISYNLIFSLLNSMDSNILKTIIKKFETSFKYYFNTLNSCKQNSRYIDLYNIFPLNTLNLLLESNLQEQIITFINTCNSAYLLECLIKKESDVSEYLCFLLSYGFQIVEYDLHLIFEKYGYCELFKILLHMDFIKGKYKNFPDFIRYMQKNSKDCYFSCYVMPFFIINVSVNVQNCLKRNAKKLSQSQLRELTNYFSHPTLNSVYKKIITEKNREKINLPQIPLLIELARNSFRKYLLERFEVQTTRQFYTILNSLPINPVYKKNITYETKLY